MNGQEVESLTGVGILGAVLLFLFLFFSITGVSRVHELQEEIREEARRQSKRPLEMESPGKVAVKISFWAIVLTVVVVFSLAAFIDTYIPVLPR